MRYEVYAAREQLVQDLNRLAYRVETLRDWHTWFRRYPAAFLGAAFAGAFLIGYALGPARGKASGGIMRKAQSARRTIPIRRTGRAPG